MKKADGPHPFEGHKLGWAQPASAGWGGCLFEGPKGVTDGRSARRSPLPMGRLALGNADRRLGVALGTVFE